VLRIAQAMRERRPHEGVAFTAFARADLLDDELTSCFILGSPGETRQDMLETFDFVRENADAFSHVHFTHLQVFPGTEVWEWAKRLGISDSNLAGVALDSEDFANADDYLRNRWPYLNEANIPREEMLGLLRLGSMMGDMVARLHDATASLHDANARSTSARFAAENIPILQIVKEKARRRLRGSRPAVE
jgi:radical SAM superfamily enzyme YgiQ (UPF0313 family)